MAGKISDEDIQKVRDATDIVALMAERAPVKQRGRDFWCCCPVHNEKTPSCKIDPALQLWHCFGCGAGGDAFKYVMTLEDLTFPEAVRYLAERAHVQITETDQRGPSVGSGQKARLKAVCRETADFYHLHLLRGKGPEADSARSYLSSRHFGGGVPKSWQLGFAPGKGALVRHLMQKGFTADELLQANVAKKSNDGRLRDRFFNRIMFPICDEAGDVIAFGGRVIGSGEPKYLNSQETPLFHKSNVLFGMDKAKGAMAATGTAIVVEGYTDVIALHEGGISNVVATLGTALTMRHIRLLSRHASKRIVYLFDGDEAGQRAADRALQFIDSSMTPEAGRTRVELFAVTLPDDLDPADFVEQRGAGELAKFVDGAEPLLKYGIDRRLARHDLTRAEGRSAALADALSILAPIKDSALAHDYALQIAGKVRVREDVALDHLAKLKPPREFDRQDAGMESSRITGHSSSDAFSSSRFSRRSMSDQEQNRLRFEREFLTLLAHNPLIALQYADALMQVQWHDEVHRNVASCMLEALAENPAIDSSGLIAQASIVEPRAAAVLMSSQTYSNYEPSSSAAFLAEELSIGDAEDALEMYKGQLSDPSGMDPQDYDLLYMSVAAMQKSIAERRKEHKFRS